MMSRFIVKLADLMEAEGRSLRSSSVKVGVAVVLALGATLLVITGAALVVLSIMLAVQPGLGWAGAAAIGGTLLLGCAGGLLWAVRHLGK